jgi:hypothetical protein
LCLVRVPFSPSGHYVYAHRLFVSPDSTSLLGG